jgi:hypothetical protein
MGHDAAQQLGVGGPAVGGEERPVAGLVHGLAERDDPVRPEPRQHVALHLATAGRRSRRCHTFRDQRMTRGVSAATGPDPAVTTSAPPSIRFTSVTTSVGSSVKSAWSVTTTSRFGYGARSTASRTSASSDAAYPSRFSFRRTWTGMIRV